MIFPRLKVALTSLLREKRLREPRAYQSGRWTRRKLLNLVELSGIEPLTSSLRTRRSPS